MNKFQKFNLGHGPEIVKWHWQSPLIDKTETILLFRWGSRPTEIVKWGTWSSFLELNVIKAENMLAVLPLLCRLLINLWGWRSNLVLTCRWNHWKEAWRSWWWGGSLRRRHRSSRTTGTSLTGFKVLLQESKQHREEPYCGIFGIRVWRFICWGNEKMILWYLKG